MNVAIPHCRGRVSPVFDVAEHILIVELDEGRQTARRQIALDGANPQLRVDCLHDAGADVLICGAISWPVQSAVSAMGVKVIPQICGNVDMVLSAYLEGQLGLGPFLMPGCCDRRQENTRKRRPGTGDPTNTPDKPMS